MGLHQEQQDRMVKAVFGHEARFDADLGTPSKPGSVRIILDGKPIGTGKDFQSALVDASRQLARITRAVAPAVAFVLVLLT